MWICIAPCRKHTSKVLRYGTHSRGISVLTAHPAGHNTKNGYCKACIFLCALYFAIFATLVPLGK